MDELPSTMSDVPLSLTTLLAHGARVHAQSEVVSRTRDGVRRARFADVAERAARLATALEGLGVGPGDRVGSFAWNGQEHLEAYLAVPAMGAVLHTANIRLSDDEIAYAVGHARDRVLLVDGTLVSRLASLWPRLASVERVVILGAPDATPPPGALDYEALLGAAAPCPRWADVDERAPAIVCYTSGTTGAPKGVVYSHRSTVLHTMGLCAGGALALHDRDRVLPVVPMFHANGWGLPYAAWWSGADLVLPGPQPHAPDLAALIAAERPTVAAGVPTVWSDLLEELSRRPVDVSSLRFVLVGGAALPMPLQRAWHDRFAVPLYQAWGLTETSPLAAIARPPRGADDEAAHWHHRGKTGRIMGGVELRLTDDDGGELPWDGRAVGEIEVRGPWVTARYAGVDAPDKFRDGWLRTGDLGTVDARGFIQITDRQKDVIKSGGEWISSVALEAELLAHPAVREAAVIAVPDERWQERPLACVVLREGVAADAAEARTLAAALRAHLSARVVRWWLPERWSFVASLPRTGVGKLDKKVLRARHAAGALAVVRVDDAAATEERT